MCSLLRSKKMKRNRLMGVLAVAALGSSGTAVAMPIYVQDPLAGGVAYFSSIGGLAQNADSFQLDGEYALDGVSWWGTATDGSLDDFTVRIFSDVSGEPADAPAVTLTGAVMQSDAALVEFSGLAVYRYDLAVANLALVAGTYYFSVANDGLDEWWWLTSAVGDASSYYRESDGDLWSADVVDFAFGVSGTRPVTVPEPGTALLLSTGLAVFALRRRLGDRIKRR